MFLDFCTASSNTSPTSKFYGVSVEKNAVGIKSIRTMPQCQFISAEQEDNESVWRGVSSFLGKFKCVRIEGSNNYETFVVVVLCLILNL